MSLDVWFNIQIKNTTAFWIADDIDSRWHSLGHSAFMQHCDSDDPANPDNFTHNGILNDMQPDIFVLTGIPRRANDPTPIKAADHALFGRLVAPTVAVGQTLLIRTQSAAYGVVRFTLGSAAEVIAMDGRALGVPPFQQYSRPFTLPANTPFRLTTAMRWDLIIKPKTAGLIWTYCRAQASYNLQRSNRQQLFH